MKVVSAIFRTGLVLAFITAQAFAAGEAENAAPKQRGLLGGVKNLIVKTGLVTPKPIQDEAQEALTKGLMTQDQFNKMKAGSKDDYLREMDYGITLPENQEALKAHLEKFIPGVTKQQAVEAIAKGRNNWIVWTGGNDRFWDQLSIESFGNLDLLKIISNYKAYGFDRSNRWEELGIVNEPCFASDNKPQANRWGLYLDRRVGPCEADPYADASKYPGVKAGARGKALRYRGQNKVLEVGSFYGEPTGVVGLRLFTNPKFDQKAADRWDPERYYNDPTYYLDPKLVKPYRVGMACAFCHVGPNPSKPPADFNNPTWANLNGNPGAQYFWFNRVFNWNYKKSVDNFVYQLVSTNRPGALDTSLISSDQINNPRTMNAVYDLASRATISKLLGHWEQLEGEERNNKQLNDFAAVPNASMLRGFFDPKSSNVIAPRVLKDGADSVGVLGALNRVYVNIGLFSEYWMTNFMPLVGGHNVTPFKIDYAAKNSGYWQANVEQTPYLAMYLLSASRKDKLSEAPGGAQYLKDMADAEIVKGKKVFAQNCAACHSSKLPEAAYKTFNDPAFPNKCQGENYLNCWQAYTQLTKTPEFKAQMESIVMQPDFLDNNYLSTDLRIPVKVMDVQLCSQVATNAIRDNIWDNFSSDSYKRLPSVGQFNVNYPLEVNLKGTNTMVTKNIMVPDGGRGFVRPASLISLWASAPYLQNNTVGKFDYRGTVEGRMASFNDSITKMLNPELRSNDPMYGQLPVSYTAGNGNKLNGFIDVTTHESYLKIPLKYIPYLVRKTLHDAITINGGHFEKDDDAMVAVFNPEASKKFVASAQIFKDPRRRLAAYSEMFDSASSEVKYLKIGPIPQGTPINLVSNLDLTYAGIDLDYAKPEIFAAQGRLIDALVKFGLATHQIKSRGLTGQAALDLFMDTAAQQLVEASKCNDFVVNRGHYFGTKYANASLTDDDRRALVEYLKHF